MPPSFRAASSAHPGKLAPLPAGHDRRWRHCTPGTRTRPPTGRPRSPGPGAGRSDGRSRRRSGRVFLHAVAGSAPLHDARGADGLVAAFEGRRPVRAIKAVREFLGPGMTGRYAREVLATAQEFGADAVLAESALPGIVIGALATGLPTAALMANIYLRPTTGFPLMGTGWLPARGLPGRVTGSAGSRGGPVAAGPHASPGQRGAGRPRTATAEGVLRTPRPVRPRPGHDQPVFRFRRPAPPGQRALRRTAARRPGLGGSAALAAQRHRAARAGRHQFDLPAASRPAAAGSASPRAAARPWCGDHGARGRPRGDPRPAERRCLRGPRRTAASWPRLPSSSPTPVTAPF